MSHAAISKRDGERYRFLYSHTFSVIYFLLLASAAVVLKFYDHRVGSIVEGYSVLRQKYMAKYI